MGNEWCRRWESNPGYQRAAARGATCLVRMGRFDEADAMLQAFITRAWQQLDAAPQATSPLSVPRNHNNDDHNHVKGY